MVPAALSDCSDGGPFPSSTDPWVAFGPDGRAYFLIESHTGAVAPFVYGPAALLVVTSTTAVHDPVEKLVGEAAQEVAARIAMEDAEPLRCPLDRFFRRADLFEEVLTQPRTLTLVPSEGGG